LERPADRIVREGDHLRFFLRGSDADGDLVQYTSAALPAGATLDPNTGQFDWPVGYAQAGTFVVPFTATSNGVSTTQTVKFPVLNANAAPQFEPLDGWRVFEGEQVRFSAFAFDPDNPDFVLPTRRPDGTLTPTGRVSVNYAVSGLPDGASFDVDTALFSWTPGFTQAGSYAVTFTATDDGDGTGTPLSSSVTVPIEVINLNRRPVIDAISPVTVARGSVFDLTVSTH